MILAQGEHWGLTHFVLDGHHKLQAAAETGGHRCYPCSADRPSRLEH